MKGCRKSQRTKWGVGRVQNGEGLCRYSSKSSNQEHIIKREDNVFCLYRSGGDIWQNWLEGNVRFVEGVYSEWKVGEWSKQRC